MDNGNVEYTFEWFIENYSYCWHEIGKPLYSPYFPTDGLKGTAWRVGCYPRGYRNGSKGYIEFFLQRSPADDGPESVWIKFELFPVVSKPKILSTGQPFKKGVGRFGCANFLRIDGPIMRRQADFVHQDTLTVLCKICKGEGDFRKVATISARTRIGIEHISFVHVVETFSTLEPNKKKTIKIKSDLKKGCVVSSSLYFNDDSNSEENIMLEIKSSDSNHMLRTRKIALLMGSGNIIVCGENDNRFDVEIMDIQKLPLSISRQVILNKKSEYLPNDKISLLCECTFSTGLEFERVEGTQYAKPTATLNLTKKVDKVVKSVPAYTSISEDMKALYVNQYLADVELKTETKSFLAHKSVLCARSPVFRVMMTNDMKEKSNNRIQVDDLEDDIVQQLLLFLYSDTMENLQWNTATQLYYAADKYQIGKLKEVCSSFLEQNITTTNAGELLLLTDFHNDDYLKEIVEHFILEHEEQVFGSEEWDTIMKTNPILAMNTMHLKYKRKK